MHNYFLNCWLKFTKLIKNYFQKIPNRQSEQNGVKMNWSIVPLSVCYQDLGESTEIYKNGTKVKNFSNIVCLDKMKLVSIKQSCCLKC